MLWRCLMRPRLVIAPLFGLMVAIPLGKAAVAGQEPVVVPEYAPARVHPLPPLRDQARERHGWLRARLERVLPRLMQEYGVAMWILSMREYGEDPVFWSISAPTTFAARRRSIYVFTLQDDGTVERLALGGGSQGGLYEAFRSTRPAPTEETGELVGGEQWRLLRELVEERDPSNIVLNIDPDWAFSDGLHAGEREILEEALGPDYLARVKREPRLAMSYIALRIPEMMPRYRKVEETVHAIIGQAFSNAVITPGRTTTDDVVPMAFLFVTETADQQSWMDGREDLWQRLDGRSLVIPAQNAVATSRLTGRQATLPETGDRLARWRNETGVTAMLVRPDRYIYASVADRLDLEAKLDTLSERLLPRWKS